MRLGTPLPSLAGASSWINGGPPEPAALAGKPVLVHFWSTSCHICHEVAAEVAAWRARYAPDGLEVIAVHQPRGPEELDAAAVTADAQGAMGIGWACALDNDHALAGAFQNEFVPAYYVFDRDHKLVHRQAGDRGFERLHDKLGEVLGQQPAA